jgi:hypothetical protein
MLLPFSFHDWLGGRLFSGDKGMQDTAGSGWMLGNILHGMHDLLQTW